MKEVDITLGLANATNARDLGGQVTRDGRRVRAGILFRANSLHNLSEADLLVLADLRLACVIDLRELAEARTLGADRLPVPAPRLVELPVLDASENTDLFGLMRRAMRDGAEPDALDFLRPDAPGGGAPAIMAETYRRFVSGPAGRTGFARALRLIADAQTLPLMFHCTAGKDRTGWLAATVLSALEVERDAIMADYLRTNELTSDAIAAIRALLDGKVSDPTVIVPMLDARAIYLEAGFAEAEMLYGGMEGYLREGLGADDALLDSLRANLLE